MCLKTFWNLEYCCFTSCIVRCNTHAHRERDVKSEEDRKKGHGKRYGGRRRRTSRNKIDFFTPSDITIHSRRVIRESFGDEVSNSALQLFFAFSRALFVSNLALHRLPTTSSSRVTVIEIDFRSGSRLVFPKGDNLPSIQG